jgi:hypothetical protein
MSHFKVVGGFFRPSLDDARTIMNISTAPYAVLNFSSTPEKLGKNCDVEQIPFSSLLNSVSIQAESSARAIVVDDDWSIVLSGWPRGYSPNQIRRPLTPPFY